MATKTKNKLEAKEEALRNLRRLLRDENRNLDAAIAFQDECSAEIVRIATQAKHLRTMIEHGRDAGYLENLLCDLTARQEFIHRKTICVNASIVKLRENINRLAKRVTTLEIDRNLMRSAIGRHDQVQVDGKTLSAGR